MPNKKSQSKEASSGAHVTNMTMMSKAFNLLVHLVLLAIAGTIIFRTVKNAGLILYSFHPVFMAIGYLILMTHGILTMADKNVYFLNMNYQKRVTAHWVLQATALVLITIAQSAIYVNKDINGWPHYQSTHSLFGLATYLLTLGATLGGSLTKFSHKLSGLVKPAMLKKGHKFAGLAVYALAVTTIFLGLNQSWNDNGDMQFKLCILGSFVVTTGYVVSRSLSARGAGSLKKSS